MIVKVAIPLHHLYIIASASLFVKTAKQQALHLLFVLCTDLVDTSQLPHAGPP